MPDKTMRWRGSTSLAYYAPLRLYLAWGEEVTADEGVFNDDPDRWAEPDAKAPPKTKKDGEDS